MAHTARAKKTLWPGFVDSRQVEAVERALGEEQECTECFSWWRLAEER